MAQYSSRRRVQLLDSIFDEIGIHQAELCKIRRLRVHNVVVDPSDVRSGLNGMYSRNVVQPICADRPIAAEEVVGEAHVLHEAACRTEIELAIRLAAINEEVDWEGCFSVHREDSGSNETEVGVRCDRIFNTPKFKFPGDGDIVSSGPVFVAVLNKLNGTF